MSAYQDGSPHQPSFIQPTRFDSMTKRARSKTPPRRIDPNLPYVPRSSGSVTNATEQPKPSKRLKDASLIATKARSNAKSAVLSALNVQVAGPICVVLRTDREMDEIEYSYVIKRETPNDIMERLEYVWGFAFQTLNLDTRRNIQTLSISLHKRFDKLDGWFWIPETRRISQIYEIYALEGKQRYDVSEIYKGATHFTYQLCPVPSMQKFSNMTRYEGNYNGFDPEAFQRYTHPFAQLPKITLPVYPHFAIYDAGRKIAKMFPNEKIPDFETHWGASRELDAHLQLIVHIYQNWMKTKPPKEFLNSRDVTTILPDSSASGPGVGDIKEGSSGTPGSRSDHDSSGDQEEEGLGGSGAVEATDMIAPGDSISCCDDKDSDSEEDEDEDKVEYWDDEYEKELFRGIREWAEAVWRVTKASDETESKPNTNSSSDGSSNASDRGHTLVNLGGEDEPLEKHDYHPKGD